MKAALVLLAAVALFAVFATANKELYAFHSKMVSEINTKQSLWTAELNTQVLDDYTSIKNMLGDLSVGSNHKDLPEKTSGWSIETAALPENFMAFDKWPQCASMMKTVHDQSACGSYVSLPFFFSQFVIIPHHLCND